MDREALIQDINELRFQIMQEEAKKNQILKILKNKNNNINELNDKLTKLNKMFIKGEQTCEKL